MPIVFKPGRIELWILGVAALLFFAFVTVPAAPKALWVLPPLMGVTVWALDRNRRAETRPDAIAAFDPNVGILQYLCLLFIPLVATAIYFIALAADLFLRTNMVIYYVTSALGAGLWIASVAMVSRRGRSRGAAATASA
jgi:hypothetical protein